MVICFLWGLAPIPLYFFNESVLQSCMFHRDYTTYKEQMRMTKKIQDPPNTEKKIPEDINLNSSESLESAKNAIDKFYEILLKYAMTKIGLNLLVILLLVINRLYFRESYFFKLYYSAISISIHLAWIDDIPFDINELKKKFKVHSGSAIFFIYANLFRFYVTSLIINYIF